MQEVLSDCTVLVAGKELQPNNAHVLLEDLLKTSELVTTSTCIDKVSM